MRIQKYVLVLFVSIFFMGCQTTNLKTGQAMQNLNTYEYHLDQSCPESLNLKVGEDLVFIASENPSTGYRWQLEQPLSLFKIEDRFEAVKTAKPMVGLGGQRSFRFKAEKTGTALIKLVYQRPWERDQIPARSWQCVVHITST
ncbi:protease inhibitor I42 family protein [Acinetobacter sp. WU_MDCI_Axc73]|nr:protease inhibitor I42 family protein [Acinetobacter sp. WU_MDCI_Axc73]